MIGEGIILGSGGESATIIVNNTVQTDVVSASDGVKTIQAKWVTDHHEIPRIGAYGDWVVTSFRDAKYDTCQQTVTVDEATTYTVDMPTQGYYLYLNGNEYTDKTGGWTGSGYTFRTSGATYTMSSGTKEENNLKLQSAGTTKATVLGTTNTIDVSAYNKLCIDTEFSTTSASAGIYYAFCQTSKSTLASEGTQIAHTSSLERTIIEIDISSKQESDYICGVVGNNSSAYGNIYKVWLE